MLDRGSPRHRADRTVTRRPGRDQLAGWPASIRVFARRQRLHPGAQLSLFEAAGGWRYSLWVTSLPERTPGWHGQLACIDAAHRVHARVEDCIRTGKDTGIGKFRSHAFALNQAWLAAALIAAALLAWPAAGRTGIRNPAVPARGVSTPMDTARHGEI